jgi:gliding motility-associated-like protein
LSKIRLDIQMIVIQCPPNETPVISTQGNNFSFEVEAGRQICFNITATDPDNDAISLRGTGSIFDLANKPIFNQGSGASPLTTQFCWTPTCDQGTNFPYVFNIEAKDNGCPPKTKVVAVTIRVKPFVGANNITGPAIRCVNATGLYEANGENDSRYDWQIIPANAGNIIQGQGSKSIEVAWVLSGNHRIEVVETSKNNCKGLSVQRIVQVLANPNIPLIEGQDTVCEFSTNNLYRTNATPNWTYSWIVSGGSIAGAANQNVLNINWGASGKGSVKLIQTNELGCASDTAEMLVFIDNASVGAINGTPSVCPNVKGVRYLIRNPQPGNTYVWTVSGGTQEWTGTSSEIKVNWGGIGSGYVEAYSISKYGCIGNPFRLNVDINHALQGMTPVGPDTLCENTALVSYYVDYTNRSEYFWSITNGVIVSGNGSNAVVVSWGASGIGRLSVYETSYDSVNNLPCISQPLSLNVYLAPYPKDTSVIGLREVCQSPLPVIYSVVGLPNSGFFWTFSGPGGIVGQGSSQIQLVLNTPGTYNLRFIETSAFGCEGEPVNISIIVHPKPTTKGITGEKTVCYPNYSNYEYFVQGFSNSRFVWQLDGGIINSGQNSNTINANWIGQQINQISVYEISSFGCIGDTLTSEVFADNPELEMLVVTVGMPEDDRMEVKWELKNAPRYDADIQLFRRDVMNNIPTSWTNRAKLNGNVSEYIDRPLNTNRNPYEYYVSGRNLCGDTILSEIHRSVLITGKRGEDGYDVYVDWTRYQGWQNGVSEYVLYRKNGNEEYLPYYSGGLDTTAYSNEGAESFKQCFRAKAKESAGNSEESWSNEVCFIFDPILWIPSAFTPNNDRLNQQFEWVWASIKTFHLEIFNRWGEKIYETRDYTKYWDGTYKGKQVQEGVYAYLLRYSGGDDKLVVKSGNIAVLR